MNPKNVPFFPLIILLVFAIFLAEANRNTSTLQLVQMIFRHGDKNPQGCYPNSPYNDASLWPGGWNNLTNKGVQRMHDLGIYFRQRYDGLISKNYSPKEVYATSTDNDRTIISAYAFLNGFYRHNNSETAWNLQNPGEGHPILLGILTKEQDRMLEVTESCPRMTEILKACLKNECQTLFKENQDIFNYFVTHSGVDRNNVFSIGLGIQCLQMKAEQGLKLPPWSDVVLQSNLSNFFMYFERIIHRSQEWKTLRSGVLCQHLIENMDDVIEASDEEKANKIKMRIFSAHDRTIADMMLSLNIYDEKNMQSPTYGSTLIFELHKEHDKYYVDVLYKNDTSSSPYKLSLPNCNSPCYIDDFKRISSSFIPEDWENDCQIVTTPLLTSYTEKNNTDDEAKEDHPNYNWIWIALICFIFIAV